MGIKDLLRFMKPYVEPIHIKKYAGKRVGIDAYSWLHKGAYSCSMELCLNMEGDKKFQYLNYCMHRINVLRHHNINPVLVFDGGNIPCKAQTEQDRHSKRKCNLDLAMAKLKEGNINAAAEIFQRAVSITPSMAHQLIQILRSENIEFVVAPYEADAQLAYLSSLDEDKGGIAAVISEDSDLLAYGCSSVVFKMDRYGNGEEIVIDKVFDSVGLVPSFRHFDKELFTGMCVLAGCDFLSSVPGIGIAKAHALVSKYRNLDRVLSTLKHEKGNQMPEDYFKSFHKAFAVFQHARIYDAESKRLKHLTPLPETLVHYLGEEIDFLGPEMSSSQATAIAEGQLDPSTMKGFKEFPSSNGQVKPTAFIKPSNAIQPSSRLLKQETTPTSCFTIVSIQKTGTKRITVMEQEPAFEKTKHKADLEEWRSLSNPSNLEKLISPLKNNILSKVGGIPAKRSSKVPDNNPFKRRKETVAVKDDCVNEQLSEVTEVEELELICISPATQRSIAEQQSVVTEIEDLETLGITPSSQKSVESKPVKKKKVTSKKKVESKKNSILNFFSRV
ncbi:exonuclease 1 [Cynara cardunculus var. scolymus]|uniref:exonuclease 1 n=1 Tax=Cynara cardunculus var. scolymus TaxID=59895 RepID=UPI000D6291B8|nr:exonuclease 1 [Cynara cardunculus var. scolymus]